MSASDFLWLRKRLQELEERVKVLEQAKSYPPARVPDLSSEPAVVDGEDVVEFTRIDKRTKAWRERHSV